SKAPVPAERDVYANENPAAYTNRASAEIQLPSRSDEPDRLSTKAEPVPSDLNSLWIVKIIHSATAPEKMRMNVKLAASIFVSLSAARQSRELLANAIIANRVRMKTRVDFTSRLFWCLLPEFLR